MDPFTATCKFKLLRIAIRLEKVRERLVRRYSNFKQVCQAGNHFFSQQTGWLDEFMLRPSGFGG